MKKNIIVIGASGHSKVIVDIIKKSKKFKMVGYIDSYKSGNFFNYPILGTEFDIPKIKKKFKIFGGIIAIGDNFLRYSMVKRVRKLDKKFRFVTLIHPTSSIGIDTIIKEGSVVMANSVINSSSIIGKHSIINSASIIEHDNLIGNFTTISPNSVTGGGVKIGNLSTIGIGVTIKHNITIGNNCVVGAGSLVLKNLKNNIVAYGIPARKIKFRTKGEIYL